MIVAAAALVVLVVGDLASTFFYHVPQHLWFTLHLRTHHDRRRSYWDHAVLSRDPAILLDGILGAIPYLAVAALVWQWSWPGALLGLALGQLHVWWRHTTDLGWKTPAWLAAVLRPLQIVLPEWSAGVWPVYVVYPPNRHLSAKVRAFVDWAADLFAKHPQLQRI